MKVLITTYFRCIFATLCILCWLLVNCFNVVASDQFIDNGDGTVSDTKGGLMWVSKDNGFPINWPDAVVYCENLQTAGFDDWRMPTLSELAGLYNPSTQNSNGYHTIKLITTTAQSCWSAETRKGSAGRFNFKYGQEYWLRQSYSGPTRVLPVRTIQ